MRHILELSAEEKLKFLDSFDLVLTDCDGVLWKVMDSIPGTGAAINLLQACGKTVGYVSNNSMRSDEEYQIKLDNLGINVENTDNIIHPVKSIIRYLRKIKFDGPIFTIADHVFDDALRKAGYKVLESEIKTYRNKEEIIEALLLREPAQAVILDIDINLNFAKLLKAQQYLNDENCLFILGASDKFIYLKSDIKVLGSAGLSNMLKESCGREPTTLGKPGEPLGRLLIEHFDVGDPKRVLFIGDALIEDISFAKSLGFQTMAVLSGATKKGELLSFFRQTLSPGFYADSLGDFTEFFRNLNISNDIVRKNSGSI